MPLPTRVFQTTAEATAYSDGVLAFTRNIPNAENPYPHTDTFSILRVRWFDGWYDAYFAPKYKRWDAYLRKLRASRKTTTKVAS